MKKLFILALAAAAMLSACNNKAEEEAARQQQALQEATKQELEVAVAERDQLLVLVNEITEDMNKIKQLENILTVSNGVGAEGTAKRAQVEEDIAAIQQTLEQRRQQIEKLEARLKKSNLNNKNLQATIESLRQQLDTQSAEIETLRANLSDAQAQISHLNTKVDSLNTTVENVTDERDAAQRESVELADEMNVCYYVAASKNELKEHKILETGFLRKTKILKGDFDQSFFVTADRRTLTSIPLYSEKAKLLTTHPESAYTLEDENGQKVLKIHNPDSFWSLSNYLVVQIN